MILVIGGSGFVGVHLVRMAVLRGERVRVFDREPFPEEEEVVPDEFVLGDISSLPSLTAAMRGCRLVFHLAGIAHLWRRDPKDFDRVNRQGTERVLEAAWRAAPDRLVYTSTESILVPRGARVAITEAAQPKLEDMIGPYCRSKLRAEQAVFRAARRGLPATVVSPTMPVGPGDRNLTPPGKMIRDFLRGKIPAYIHGTLNLVDVRDVAAGHLAAASSGEVGQRLLLAGHNLTVGDFLRHLATASGRPAPRLRLPYSVALGWSGAEHLWAALGGGPPRSSITGVRLCRRSLAFDGSRTWTQLGHQPRPLAETVADAVAWHDAELRAARGRARPRWPVRWLGSGDDAPP